MQGFETVNSVKESLSQAMSHTAGQNDCVLTAAILLTINTISHKVTSFNNFISSLDNMPSRPADGLNDMVNEIITVVLLAIQKLVKNVKTEGQDDKDDDLEEGHITQHLTDSISHDVNLLSMTKVSVFYKN